MVNFMARTVDFKFNEPGHELRPGNRAAGRPYFIVTLNSPAGDSYFRTVEDLTKATIAMPNNPIHVKGTILILINGNHLLYSAPLEALEAKMIDSFDARPHIPADNNLSVVIDCKETSGSEPYIVQLDLS